MQIPNTPLFVKTHDFVVWLIRHTQRFPKNLRQSYTTRLEGFAFEFEETILMANAVRGAARKELLNLADGKLACLRAFLRYAEDFQLLGGNQLRYAAECADELGRLLGAWQKGTDR
ncbi:MAG: four helix bundle protein [Planctomycetales bacterium]